MEQAEHEDCQQRFQTRFRVLGPSQELGQILEPTPGAVLIPQRRKTSGGKNLELVLSAYDIEFSHRNPHGLITCVHTVQTSSRESSRNCTRAVKKTGRDPKQLRARLTYLARRVSATHRHPPQRCKSQQSQRREQGIVTRLWDN